MRLTKTSVESEKLVPAEGAAYYWDDTLKGFGLRVTSGGVRTYIFQGRVNRKTRRVSIGRHGVWTIKKARDEARRLAGLMSSGIDPKHAAEQREKEGMTLRDAADDYAANKRRRSDGKPLADSTKADIQKHVDRSFGDWADRPVKDIDADMVIQRYQALTRRSLAQGNQAMRVLSAILNYVIRRHRGVVMTTNPVSVLRDASLYKGDAPGRKTRIKDADIGAFYSTLRQTYRDPKASPGIRVKAGAAALLLLTGLRKSDVVARQWSDADLQAQTLHVPDTKHREPRTFPLAKQAMDVIRTMDELADDSEYIFPGRAKSGRIEELRDGMRRAVEVVGYNVTPHDFRRTYIDVCEAVGVDPLVAELLSNRKGAAYQALATRMRHYDTGNLSRYADQVQRIADYIDHKRLAYEADNVVSLEAQK